MSIDYIYSFNWTKLKVLENFIFKFAYSLSGGN
jgi:hypothetical protein